MTIASVNHFIALISRREAFAPLNEPEYVSCETADRLSDDLAAISMRHSSAACELMPRALACARESLGRELPTAYAAKQFERSSFMLGSLSAWWGAAGL